MSEFPPSAGCGAGGSWCPPTPVPSPNPHNSGIRTMQSSGVQQPFQCGICYDYLSHSVDILDEHIMHHKRELANRLDAQKESTNGAQEIAFHPQEHQQVHYFTNPNSASSQGQTYEYQTQSCGNAQQVPQFRDYRTHTIEYRTSEEYYGHHQGTSSGLVNLYATESLPNRSAGGSTIQQQPPQEDYGGGQVKQSRFDNHAYERDTLHVIKSDMVEDDAVDCNQTAETLQNELEHGPVAFTDPQTSSSVAYHEMQPLKSSNVTGTLNTHREDCGTQHVDFNTKQETAQGGDEGDTATPNECGLLTDSASEYSPANGEDEKQLNAKSSKETKDNFNAELNSTNERVLRRRRSTRMQQFRK